MHAVALQLDSARRREFRQWLVASLVAHFALAGAFVISPSVQMEAPRGAVAVELISDPTAAPVPTPARAPAPPKPAPPPPTKKIVLPETPAEPIVKPEAKPIVKAEVKPKPKPKPKPAPVAKPPEPVEQDLDDLLAQMRSEAGEAQPSAVVPARPTALAGAGGSGSPVSPQVAAWLKRAEIHVRGAWVMPAGFRMQPLVTTVEVELDTAGNVVGEPDIVQRSGNPWYDDNVVRGIRKASPLPAPPSPGEWTFQFNAEDGY